MTMRGMPVTTASSCNSCLLAVNLVFWSQTLTAYSLLLFLLVLEVQLSVKTTKSTLVDLNMYLNNAA